MLFETFILYLALRELRALSIKPFSAPGEPGWPLGGIFPIPETKAESGILIFLSFILFKLFTFSCLDSFKAYFKQAREELCIRLCDRLFEVDGTKNKWWQVILFSFFRKSIIAYFFTF